MPRTLSCAPVVAFALLLSLPGAALAQQREAPAREGFPQSAAGVEVRGDGGEVLGHVGRVERDGRGRIVAVEIEGLEPGDAPHAPANLISQDERREHGVRADVPHGGAGGERTTTR